MKKAFLACLFMFSCTLIPVSANTTINEENKNTIKYTEEGIPIISVDELKPTNIDLSDGLIAQPSINPLAYGDVIYNYSYLTVPARRSVNLGLIRFGYDGDCVKIDWSGATSYTPQMDIIIAYSDGTQFSLYESKGFLVNTNTGSIILEGDNAGSVHFWFRSLNYSDVTFHRVSLLDAAI